MVAQAHKINYIVHLAGVLSALGEPGSEKLASPKIIFAASNAMRVAQTTGSRIFIPSSVAALGGNEKYPTNYNKLDLNNAASINVTRAFNETIGEFYAKKYVMDFRSLRYPAVVTSHR